MFVSSALSITQITAEFNMSRQGVSKHIKILEKAELIQITIKGRERYCKANPKTLKEIIDWLSLYEKFWDNSLNNLSSYLNNS
jgi:DNA-binding transcriptional ArsR family regulator